MVLGWFGTGLLGLLLGADAAALPVLQPSPLAVNEQGECPFTLGGESGSGVRQYLLIVGTPDARVEPRQIKLHREPAGGDKPRPADAAVPLPIAVVPEDEAWRQLAERRRQVMQARRAAAAQNPSVYVAARFAPQKVFHVFTNADGMTDVGQYHAVTAELTAVGEHCLVYVDKEDLPAGVSRALAEEVVETFDKKILPEARRTFGAHRDVDRDGKFTILFSHWLSHLNGGKTSVGGFVRGGDFYRDVDPPFSNQCDMLYLSSALKPGPHLRTLLAHEYTHAVTFCEHVFGDYLPGEVGIDEEGWLNEAISHLAENQFGDGWSNLDYRVSAFLTAPEKYRLVVNDYFREGLWRCHGSRGSTYLFLRWCVDRWGTGLLRELTQSSLGGVENLETATQTPWHELFRAWCCWLALDGIDGRAPSTATVNPRGRLGAFQLGGPRWNTLPGGVTASTIAATSVGYWRIVVLAGQSERVTITSKPGLPAAQVTLVRLPDDLPVVELLLRPESDQRPRPSLRPALDERLAPSLRSASDERSRPGEGAVTMTFDLRHSAGRPVRWERLTWERETPAPQRESQEIPKPGHARAEEVFARAETRAGDRRRGRAAITLPTDCPVIVKAIGRDSIGRCATAWGRWDPSAAVAAADTPR